MRLATKARWTWTLWGLAAWASAVAQLPMGLPSCGTDAAHHELLELSPGYGELRASMDEQWAWVQTMPIGQPQATMSSQDMDLWTLPVVVHIYHLGSPVGEGANISDAQVLSAIEALNEDFRKVEGSAGDGDGVDVGVEFVLAQRDPDDAPSSGIVRLDATNIPGFEEHGIASAEDFPGVDEVTVKSASA